MTFDLGAIIATVVGLILGVIGYLLAKKDAQQEKLIDDLFDKHEIDARQLQHLEIKLAENYHAKPDVKGIIEDMKTYIGDRFNRLEARIAALDNDRRDSK